MYLLLQRSLDPGGLLSAPLMLSPPLSRLLLSPPPLFLQGDPAPNSSLVPLPPHVLPEQLGIAEGGMFNSRLQFFGTFIDEEGVSGILELGNV